MKLRNKIIVSTTATRLFRPDDEDQSDIPQDESLQLLRVLNKRRYSYVERVYVINLNQNTIVVQTSLIELWSFIITKKEGIIAKRSESDDD